MSTAKKTNTDEIIIIGALPHKRSFVKFARNLSYLFAMCSLLLSPFLPFFIILAVFFGFIGKRYSKALKRPSISTSDIQLSDTVSVSAAKSLIKSSLESSGAKGNSSTHALSFKVAGVTFENDNKKKIQSIIKSIVKELRDSYDKDYFYDGMSNSEIKEEFEFDSDLKIFEINDESIDDIYFVLNPDNIYDPNAIKVVSEEYGHLGHVPKNLTKKMKQIMDTENFNTNCTITGGKFKYYDDEEGKVLIDTWDYGLSIEVE